MARGVTMEDSGQSETNDSQRALSASASMPFVVGVTGHSDLVPGEIADIRQHVRDFLNDLIERYPDCAVTVMTRLTDGADQLAYEGDAARKVSYMLSVDGQPYQVGAGEYNDTATVEELDALLLK